jgi:aerobic-type carbon monoxide dehydrogenase small subunit (CoxS/CutS family)
VFRTDVDAESEIMTVCLRFRLNHEDVEIHVRDPASTLLDVLRDDLGLTGTKSGCAIGYCGACTVIVDGEAVPACLRMVGLLEGREVRTIEDLSGPEGLDPVQAAFVKRAGLQCGFCTPGHVMALRALLDEEPEPDDERIRQTVDGNYCRCTGYVKLLDAAREAVAVQRTRAGATTSQKEKARTGAKTSRGARAGAATSPEGRR